MNTTGYDYVPRSRAPEQPTYDLHRHDYPQNAFNQRHDMVSSWEDHRQYAEPSPKSGDMREVPPCFHCGVRGHVVRFCAERRRAHSRYYEQPPPVPRWNCQRSSVRWIRDSYFGNGFQQNSRSYTSFGNGF
ncbi:hypothetical protein HPB50_011014 [Hyalomma asiaticum]|uniref:Uncharacterized protein n=1 Tax=Hyalomma asiaticum TaxID=266040 RepID=A0ACB7RRI7_HYAAI|nr:hypothetical protein HPB50_011014 [Hyalomma asiaticum]